MLIRSILLLPYLVSTTWALFGSMKNVTVVGQLRCDHLPVRADVQLWEKDRIDASDKLNTTMTDNLGRFKIYGQTRELLHIEPYILVNHHCENGVYNEDCDIMDRYDVPSSAEGKLHDFGVIALHLGTPKQKKKCHTKHKE
ncbi:hypothetical protein AB6A40_004699 [Gnathostoma spinigerum]|uniref:Uncharacterized protein n=1 Tax=Gnathostoma spinigerum TaxID=75299 RepID=A0ABD6ED99_9BILA